MAIKYLIIYTLLNTARAEKIVATDKHLCAGVAGGAGEEKTA
ncbi:MULTISPECIES: hypothetical protein [Nostocales]|uniref:Uncharacterized protein n=2 Tax=Nostocales TaxID=1161 RepID=A0ABW8WR56_9CYAN|nr:hypothetical protein [Tolypothrix bouteillei]